MRNITTFTILHLLGLGGYRSSLTICFINCLNITPSAFSRRAVVSYWRKYVHEVLVNRLGGLSLPRKSVVRLTDRPDMTLDVYRGRKTTIQPTNLNITFMSVFKELMKNTDKK